MDLLIKMASEVYRPYVVFENVRKVLYVQVLRALYLMFIEELLWYNKFKLDLEKQGLKFNPYDACVTNKITNKKQHTVRCTLVGLFNRVGLWTNDGKTVVMVCRIYQAAGNQ